MRILLLVIFAYFNLQCFAQDKPVYHIYNSNGDRVSYQSMIEELSGANIVLFGEEHNCAIAHWLQYEVTADLHKVRKLVLGAEMLEADNQDELDDYLKGKIDKDAFDTLVRLWSNHETDYAPLVEFAKENKLKFIATNIPRRYASIVYKKGFEGLDALTKEEKKWIAPLPIPFDSELPEYKKILEIMGEHGTPELVKAQAIKDATMGYFIVENRKKKELFIHYNGSFHSNYYEGIGWYLKQYSEDEVTITISTVVQDDIENLEDEHNGVADFIICVDSNMTTTY
ncbi:MAG: ChaN family lipoprotein [Crocinitomicaceae bacterium]|nr:ChaN family lipoprotein [Crocinitomicaceae bacterium]